MVACLSPPSCEDDAEYDPFEAEFDAVDKLKTTSEAAMALFAIVGQPYVVEEPIVIPVACSAQSQQFFPGAARLVQLLAPHLSLSLSLSLERERDR